MKAAVIIIAFNTSDFLLKQIELLKRFCTDPCFDIIVIDNSTNELEANKLRDISSSNGCKYMKTTIGAEPSYSHAYAANTSYSMYSNEYDLMFYCDQDLFPVKAFSIEDISRNKSLSGIAQGKEIGGRFVTYLWPGALFINHEILQDKKSILDFNPETGLDTGGKLYKIIDSSSSDHIQHFDEQPWTNPYFDKNHYDFYSMIYKETFMHFICGSNWANKDNHSERIESLFRILSEKIDNV